jgi:hypothetical protein
MNPSTPDALKTAQGCDIPEPASLAEVLGALKQRSAGRAGSWLAAFRRWGSASWARAWLLGVGLILGSAGLAWGVWALLTFLGRVGAPWVDVELPDSALGAGALSAALGLAVLGAALFLSRLALWVGLEGPIRIWSRVSRGVSGQPAGQGVHCFAPWTVLSLWALACCFPALIGGVALEASRLDARNNEASTSQGAAPTPAAMELAKLAQNQVQLLAQGATPALSDRKVALGARDDFWDLALDSWSHTMKNLIAEKATLTDPAQKLQKNPAALQRGKERVGEIIVEQTRLINGYWATLGVDKEAPHLASLRLSGFRRSGVSDNEMIGLDAGRAMVFCLPMPSAELNDWMARRSAFSAPARQAMASYLTSDHFSSDNEKCATETEKRIPRRTGLSPFGAFIENEYVKTPDAERPGQTTTDWHYQVNERARGWVRSGP